LHGFAEERKAFEPIAGMALVAMGEVERGLLQIETILAPESAGSSFNDGTDWSRVYYSTALRASGRVEKSLYEAERALEGLERDDLALLSGAADLEVAASMLSLGDVSAAARLARDRMARVDALNQYQQLRAAMILAQVDVLAGNIAEAVDRIRPFRDYILTGSSNWQSAMYVCAFPQLIAPLAIAVGVEDLPVRMLRMVLPENSERSLSATRELMPEAEWVALGRRLLGAEEFLKWIEREGRPLCRVKMFGGFEVTIGPRSISEKDWKKRKARALFAILASRNGHAITRDQLCDHLWPHMDDDRARNNLYVAWSVMKSALQGPDAKSAECPYIEAVGGLCRTVSDVVRTDVDEFDGLVAEAKVAQTSGNAAAAILAYERLADIYRGELLPGDLYDDWFQPMRDRYRHEFCDAMLRGSAIALAVDDAGTALQFARRGLGSDSFREDLYQAALRAQISACQRSAAIETYFECRSKLIDELGLDPSAETRALYDQVLVLEERTIQPHQWGVWLSGEDSPETGGPI
jgi:DNA-binding SARP family transcriptional activator